MRINRIFFMLLALSVCLTPGCRRAPVYSTPGTPTGEPADMAPGGPREDSEGIDGPEVSEPRAEDTAGETSAESFLDTLTFLGDSTTAHMLARAPLRDGAASRQVWASANRCLNLDSRITYAKIVCPDTGEEATIAEAAARLKPRYLVVTLGIDYGVWYYRDRPETFRFYYEKLLDAIGAASPDTRIVLQSIFPVGRNCTVLTNEMVDRANDVVRALAAARGLPYLDTASILRDDEGFLRPDYCYSEDGIHLTASAYRAIFDHIAAHETEIRGGLNA